MSSVDVHHLILSDDEVGRVEKALVTIEAIEHALLAFGVEIPPYAERPSRVLKAIVERARRRGPMTLATGDRS